VACESALFDPDGFFFPHGDRIFMGHLLELSGILMIHLKATLILIWTSPWNLLSGF